MKLPKTFFGWTNLKWLIKEFIAMYSTKDSYFSKKRFESSMAFLSAMFLIMGHAIYNRATITNSEILADAALLFVIAGYTVKQIQTEKTTLPPISEKTEPIAPIAASEPAIKDDGDLEA